MTDVTANGKLGIVVVGVGIAGRVRIRDISHNSTQEDSCWKVIGYVSRIRVSNSLDPDEMGRHAASHLDPNCLQRRQIDDIEGVAQISEEEALSRSDVHAMIICTEPGAHETLIRKALSRGKHVLVEFPVTTSLASTRELFCLASEKEVVLHEENIALLTQSFLDVQEELKAISSPVVKVELKLLGSYNGWVEDFKGSGGPFVVNVSLIQTLYVLFGEDLKATGGQLVMDEEGFTATAKLATSKCSDLNIEVRRTKEKSRRHKTLRVVLKDGSVIEDSPQAPATTSDGSVPKSKKVGLFMEDFLLFVSEVNKKRDYSADRDRVLHCMTVVEQIHTYMGLKST